MGFFKSVAAPIKSVVETVATAPSGIAGDVLTNPVLSPWTSLQYKIADKLGISRDEVKASIPNLPKPGDINFQSLTAGGDLPSQFKLSPNTQGLEALREIGLSDELSPWAQGAMAGVGVKELEAKDDFKDQIASEQAMAQRNLAMRGGMRSADQAGLGRQAQAAQFSGFQNLGRARQLANLDIQAQDEAIRDRVLGALPGMEIDATKPQMSNIDNFMSQRLAESAFNAQNYQNKMKGWAAEKTGKTIGESGKK